MYELPMHFKDIRATPIIDTVVYFSTHRSKCQCIVISANKVAKFFSNGILPSIIILQLRRRWLQIWKGNLSLITTYTKLGISLRRPTKALICPMECMAGRAFRAQISKAMNIPFRVERISSNRKKLDWWQLYTKLMHHKLGLYLIFDI
jgi:hypothetical protein